MVIEGEVSININGQAYWTVRQFSNLTDKEQGTIRVLINKGNRLRRLKTVKIARKPFILASELFDFPFVINGHPAVMGDFVNRFVLDEGRLIIKEECWKREV